MMDRFWSYDGCAYNRHATAEEAIEQCQSALDEAREDAPEGWPEWVEDIAWGEIMGHIVETERREHLPECADPNGGYDCVDACGVASNSVDYWVDYALVEVPRG